MSFASNNSTMRGCDFFDSGRSPRTRDRSRDNEVAPQEPKTERERQAELADIYLAAYERRQAEDRADEQRKKNEQHQRQLREQAEADRKRKDQELAQRRAQASFIEGLQDNIFDESGLTREERALVLRRLDAADSEYDLEASKVETLRVISEKNGRLND